MVPKIETLTTTLPMRFAPRDAETTFRDGGHRWTVAMIDPTHWPRPQRTVDVLWQINPTGIASGSMLGWFYVAPDGFDAQARFEISAIDDQCGMTHFEMFSLHARSAIPAVNIPTAKLIRAARNVGHVVGRATKRRGRWADVIVQTFENPSGKVDRLPANHPTQIENTFYAYTTARPGKRVQAVMDATGFGIDRANDAIQIMKKDPKWKPQFAKWQKGQNK